MSYRIEVDTEARSLLQTISPHLVLRLGHALAEMAEALSSGEAAASPALELDACALQVEVDHREQLLKVFRPAESESRGVA
jgi:hypothetical protein